MPEFRSGAVATLSVDGVDISGYIESAKLDRKAKDERHHVLGGNPVVTLVHSAEFTLTVKGLIDPTVSPVFSANLGPTAPPVPVIYGPQGNAAGSLRRTFSARVTDYSEDTEGEKTGMFDATLSVDGALVDDTF